MAETDCKCPDLLAQEPEARQILNGTPVLDRCIREALRLYPPSPMIGRTIHTPLDTRTLSIHINKNYYTLKITHVFLQSKFQMCLPLCHAVYGEESSVFKYFQV